MPRSRAEPVASRRYAELGPQRLELGGTLPAVRLAFQTWGKQRGHNTVLVLHALTGDAHVSGTRGPDQPTPGWWDEVVGPGRALDTNRWFVVAANVLGGCRGSTGPSSAHPDGGTWGSRFPRITVRDQVAAEAALADHLGVRRFAAVIGGSMGGMRALEWGLMHPDRVGSLVVLASTAAASADQIGTQSTQIEAITSDPGWHGGDYRSFGTSPGTGLGIARRIAHLTYRSADELDARFGRQVQPDGRYAVRSYLDHHASKLVRRFDAGSYVALTDAMNTHDVGRDRGGVDAALSTLRVPTTVAGISSDRLYPLAQQERIAATAPGSGPLQVIGSEHGHDGFLVESAQVGALIREALVAASNPASA
ncbi:MAG: homoserine O-acetyltransferase [Marmoricola sp.]|nr:homoserine O-acetyltransferase [Marmoricola sp.]